jgi:hypothetical protein
MFLFSSSFSFHSKKSGSQRYELVLFYVSLLLFLLCYQKKKKKSSLQKKCNLSTHDYVVVSLFFFFFLCMCVFLYLVDFLFKNKKRKVEKRKKKSPLCSNFIQVSSLEKIKRKSVCFSETRNSIYKKKSL